MKTFIIFADGWGSLYGGINSLNYDFVLALGKTRKCNVICWCVNANERDIKEAQENNVKLVNITQSDFSSNNFNFLISAHVDKIETNNLYWVGHDIKTGHQAIHCRNTTGKGKLILFNHMDYQEIYLPRKFSLKTEKRVQEQTEVFSKADYVFAVGPKLYRSAVNRKNNGTNLTTKIFEFLPGLAEIQPISVCNDMISGVTFGRIEEDNDIIKQTILAVRAFSKSCANNNHLGIPMLSLIGVSGDDKEIIEASLRINNIIKEETDKYTAINLIPYTSNRIELYKKLRSMSFSLMLSLSEGFGLAGLEAIAAGVPLILTKNSGLYEYLHREHLDLLVHAVDIRASNPIDRTNHQRNQIDVETVSKEIDKIINNVQSNKKLALILREKISELLSWNCSALNFLSDLKILPEHHYVPNDTIQDALIHDFINKGFTIEKDDYLTPIDSAPIKIKDKFETQNFYNVLLSNADKRLWIYGRKNRKLFSNDNRPFFSDLKRRLQNGFDFKCLFLSPNLEPNLLEKSQKFPNFIGMQKNCIEIAKGVLKENGISFEEVCKFYHDKRDEVIIVIDNKVIYTEINFDESGYPQRLTGTSFNIIDTESKKGKEKVKKFQSIWKHAKEY